MGELVAQAAPALYTAHHTASFSNLHVFWKRLWLPSVWQGFKEIFGDTASHVIRVNSGWIHVNSTFIGARLWWGKGRLADTCLPEWLGWKMCRLVTSYLLLCVVLLPLFTLSFRHFVLSWKSFFFPYDISHLSPKCCVHPLYWSLTHSRIGVCTFSVYMRLCARASVLAKARTPIRVRSTFS